jgi:hypothetical protein
VQRIATTQAPPCLSDLPSREQLTSGGLFFSSPPVVAKALVHAIRAALLAVLTPSQLVAATYSKQVAALLA